MVSQVANQKPISHIAPRKKYPAPQIPGIEELKRKQESEASGLPNTKTKSSKLLKKFKVQQMVSMFNSKISQILRHDVDVNRYETLVNELSPEPKPVPQATQPKSVPFPRICDTEEMAESQRKASCFVAEDLKDPKYIDTKTVDHSEPKALELVLSIDSAPQVPPRRKKRAPSAPQQQLAVPVISSECSTSPTTEHSEAEQSKSLLQNKPNEAQHEKPQEDVQKEVVAIKPTKPIRKKKIRRTLSSRKTDANIISTTDSESDCHNDKPSAKMTVNKPHAVDLKRITDDIQAEPSFVELDKSWMRAVNSPRKIKSAYTLTVCTPHPNTDTSLNKRREELLKNDMSGVGRALIFNHSQENNHADDSSDQGFETGSNEVESPIMRTRRSSLKRQSKLYPSLLTKLATNSYQTCIHSAQNIPDDPTNFSTPIKARGQRNLSSAFNDNEAPQQICSPIAMPVKMRRRSIYANEPRRSSLAMHVINEDRSLDRHHEMSNTDVFFANAPTIEMTADITNPTTSNTSSFWIKSGDFSIALDIHKNDPERVQLLYEIFSQVSCDTKEVHFGIDDHQFSVDNTSDEGNISKRLPQNKEISHYWFSTGDLVIPFSGKLLTSEKIQRIFQFIKASVEETGVLCFGSDDVEFSKVPEFWIQAPKYSMESGYSILVGLQSDNSNGLEGRSKYDWPHSKPMTVGELDHVDFESDYFEEHETACPSLDPIASNLFDLEAGEAVCPESFCKSYENEPLDQLFNDKLYLSRC